MSEQQPGSAGDGTPPPPAWPAMTPPTPYTTPPPDYTARQYPAPQYPAPQYPAPQYPAPQPPPPHGLQPYPNAPYGQAPYNHYAPYGGYPPPGRIEPVTPPRRVRGWGIATLVVAGLVLLSQIGELLVAEASGVYESDSLRAGIEPDSTDWDGMFAVSVFALLIAYVVTCLWLYRARGNAAAISRDARFSLSRGWAWGGWVTPVVAFWFPFLVVRDTLRASRPGSEHIAGGWFAVWLLWAITEFWVPVILSDDRDMSRWLGTWEVISLVLCAGAFALWAQVVVRVTGAQTSWLDRSEP